MTSGRLPVRTCAAAILLSCSLVAPAAGGPAPIPQAEQAAPPPSAPSAQWPSFRGPGASGVADGEDLPDLFDGAAGTNLAWKTEIPGFAHASPIVWDDRVYLTTAVSQTPPPRFFAEIPDTRESVVDENPHRWLVIAIDLSTGEILWERTAAEGAPRTGRLRKGTFNNSTPATDGEHIVALFGSQGLFCYDRDGNLLWHVDLGVLDAGWFFDPTVQWGTASSPIIHDGRVIVQVDVFAGSFLAAFDVADGSELWRTPRDEVSSWATPTVVEGPQGDEVVTNGGRAIRGYDAATGEPRWSLTPSSEIAVPTPVFAEGLVFVGSGYLPSRPLHAIRPGGSGDISLPDGSRRGGSVAWTHTDVGPLITTPIVVGDYLFLLHRDGTLACFDARTGLPMFRERFIPEPQTSAAPLPEGAAPAADASAAASPTGEVPTRFTASPVAAAGNLYLTSDAGDVYVIPAGPLLKVRSVNPVGESVLATPAIAGGKLIVRGLRQLYAFER